MRKILAVVCALAVGGAFADKVMLKSGSFLTGKAGVLQGDVLSFASDDLGDVKIKVANIVRLESDRQHVVRYADGHDETLPLTVADGAYQVDGKAFDMTDVKAVDPTEETWHGSVNFAFSADRGNTYNNSGSLVANVNRRFEKDRINANFGYYYTENGTSRDDKEKTTDRWEIEGQYDHFWLSKVYSYVNAKYDRDMIAGIDYRFRMGGGLGYQWLEKSKFETTGLWSFNQELGASWVRTGYIDRDDDAEDSYATIRYAHHLDWFPRWNTGVDVFHNFEYLPDVDDTDIYLAKADIGFTTKIVMDFDLLAKIEWNYDSMPSAGRKSSDVRYLVGLGYKW